MAKINKHMTIKEIIEKYPETAKVFGKYGFHCIGCAAAGLETLERGAAVHGVEVEKIVKELNKAV